MRQAARACGCHFLETSLLVARLFSFMPAALFETDDAARALPNVDFGANSAS